MNLLFVHGAEKLKEDKKGTLYSSGSYSQDVWNRYLSISKDLSVIFRKEDKIYDIEVAKQKFNFFDKEKIKFIQVNDINKSIKDFISYKVRKENDSIVKNAIKDCDMLIARVPSDISYIAIKYAKEYNKPYMLEVVGCPWDTLWNHSLRGKILAIPSYLKLKNNVKEAKYVIYVSSEFLQRRYQTNGYCISCSNAVVERMPDDILLERLKKNQKIKKENKIILGSVGAVNVKYKGQQYVIRAISELNKEGYDLEYHIVGGGDNTYLKSVAEKYNVVNKVFFKGALAHEEVFEQMKKIDIYIQPSTSEGLPRALIEAMSMGCPCIGSNVGGIPELIQKEFVFKKKKYRDLKNKIELIFNSNLEKICKENFENAKGYQKEVLNSRRKEFYNKFIRGE